MRPLLYCLIGSLTLVACGESTPEPVVETPVDTPAVADTAVTDFVKPPLPTANDFNERFAVGADWRMSDMDSLIKAYQLANDTVKGEIQASVDDTLSRQLLAYAYHTSTWAVEMDNTDMLFDGYTALAIENGQFDFKATLAGIALIHHTAGIKKVDFTDVHRRVGNYPAPLFQQINNDFLSRDSLQRAISIFGYFEIRDPFDYVREPLYILDPNATDSAATELNSDSLK